jgi:predicted metalloendopeptidase
MSHIPGDFGRRKCPCCNNPWNANDVTIDGSVDSICKPCLSDSKGYTGIDPENFDPNVSPRDNFYLWSNGGWKAKNPIPAEYSSWNTFIALRDQNLERLKAILDELGTRQSSSYADNTSKLGDFYQAFMDEDTIEKLGVKPIREAIDVSLGALVSSVQYNYLTANIFSFLKSNI